MHKTKNIIMASTFFKRWKMIKTAITKDHHKATKVPKPKGLDVETKLIINHQENMTRPQLIFNFQFAYDYLLVRAVSIK